ncbi:hypothetical protein F8568_032030 [Actinomadura sp. LD22]|uniref:histidine kinase n=2 Tax=Actinomadura physcomitrii TaxID=2650748 RepID=A0A6I4MJZ9_9ACTN|nr:hypothetical protein [Actinomadura physcomitrii]
MTIGRASNSAPAPRFLMLRTAAYRRRIENGPGIPQEEREAVFQRFYRRADARRSDPEGTGLGLPIARQIARAHHGDLHIADHPGGTRMLLRLPCTSP